MPNQSLHPNLARLASAYDDIISRHQRREISASQARSDILALIARDDNGTNWGIDPDTGDWHYRDIRGKLIPSDPPSYGLATPTAHDLSNNPNIFNPDTKIQFKVVDESLLHPPGSLSGSTRRAPENESNGLKAFFTTKPGKLSLVVLAGIIAVLIYVNFIKENEPEVPVPDPAPAAVSVFQGNNESLFKALETSS